MPPRALLLDLDGTLVASNDAHTDAWTDALTACGYDVPREAVARRIGMGGDLLVPDLLGEAAEARDGDRLRTFQGERFRAQVRAEPLALFPGAEALFEAARAHGLRIGIATSADEANLDALFASAGRDLRPLADAVTTASDVDESKPEPDVLHAALRRLGVAPREALFIGDTIYDGEAARRAGVPFLGVATWVWDRGDLQRASARAVYHDTGDLLAHLDAALLVVQ